MSDSEKHWNRCGVCGRFFSYLDIERGKITSDFTPDSAFTHEKIEFFHKGCVKIKQGG